MLLMHFYFHLSIFFVHVLEGGRERDDDNDDDYDGITSKLQLYNNQNNLDLLLSHREHATLS